MVNGVRVLCSSSEVTQDHRRCRVNHNHAYEACQAILMHGVDADQFVNDNVGRFVSDLSANARRALMDELVAQGH